MIEVSFYNRVLVCVLSFNQAISRMIDVGLALGCMPSSKCSNCHNSFSYLYMSSSKINCKLFSFLCTSVSSLYVMVISLCQFVN